MEVKLTIDGMPKDSPRQREHYFRLHGLFSLLYLCGLRIFEVIYNLMGSFFWRRDAGGQQRWWLGIMGKGSKLRLVPATDELMVDLVHYRRELGQGPYPVPAETNPLLLPIDDRSKALTHGAIHAIVNKYSI